MKVTAILPDKLILDVKKLSHGKNITESLKIALIEWVKIQNLKKISALETESYLIEKAKKSNINKYLDVLKKVK